MHTYTLTEMVEAVGLASNLPATLKRADMTGKLVKELWARLTTSWQRVSRGKWQCFTLSGVARRSVDGRVRLARLSRKSWTAQDSAGVKSPRRVTLDK